jgi:hypothetical protein
MHGGIMKGKTAHSNFSVRRESRKNCIHMAKQLTHHKVTGCDEILPCVLTAGESCFVTDHTSPSNPYW